MRKSRTDPKFTSLEDEIGYLRRKIAFLTEHADATAHALIAHSNGTASELERKVWVQGMDLEKQERTIGEKAQTIIEKERMIGEQERIISEKEGMIGEQERMISEKDLVIEEKERELDNARLLIQELADLKNSTSWKITRPLRQAVRLIGLRE